MKKQAVKEKTATNVLESFGYYDRDEDSRQAGFGILVGVFPMELEGLGENPTTWGLVGEPRYI